ncbi:MAG: aspartate/glutamate racemase family protein [Albidovulum sp.]|nr:aspartate/glutamate racemase family protein [Albidovulum sp.]MDE0530620.1 aspartate/glutamate racemase family protein [Albidovulum sp.]
MNLTPPRMLVINPNSNQAVTGKIREVVGSVDLAGCDVDVTHPAGAPHAIATPEDRQAVEPDVVAMVQAAHAAGATGFVLACFDDIGVHASRLLVEGPVIDASEAGFIEIQRSARRFSVVTTFQGAVERISALAEKQGVEGLCSVRAAGIDVGDAISGKGLAMLLETVSHTIIQDNPDAILLGSGGYAGLSERVARHAKLPIVDGVAAAIKLCCGSLAGRNADRKMHGFVSGTEHS